MYKYTYNVLSQTSLQDGDTKFAMKFKLNLPIYQMLWNQMQIKGYIVSY